MPRILSLVLIAAAAFSPCRAADPSQPSNLAKAMIEKSQSFGLKHFPIGFWNYTNLKEHGQHMTEAEVESWADAGFTVPQSPRFDPKDAEQVAHIRRLLDWAHARGMKLILCDPRGQCPDIAHGNASSPPADYAEGIREAVSQFGDHPALFGLHVGDEPDAEAKARFFACYRIQKELAPKLHPFANLLPFFPGIEKRAGADTWANYLDQYVKDSNADLLCYDCYTQMNTGRGGWHSYYQNLRLYREAALRNGVPFWNTVLSVAHYRYRCPNADEIRWQFNTTIASGAHGVMWFFYYMGAPPENYRMSPVDEHWERTPTYYDLRRVQKSFHRRSGNLFTRLACTRVMFSPKAFGGGEVFRPDGLVSRLEADAPDHPLLLSEFVDIEGRRYVMLVNNSMSESVHAEITFPGEVVKVFSWDWNGQKKEGPASAATQERNKDGLNIHHWLAPGQEVVYCIE